MALMPSDVAMLLFLERMRSVPTQVLVAEARTFNLPEAHPSFGDSFTARQMDAGMKYLTKEN